MNSAKILVIDDEAQIRRLLQITLQSHGFSVSEAVSGKEGLTVAANHPPDLILLDMGLPDQDGQEILVKLREWYTGPIIILSVRSTEEDMVKALDGGADDYLVKPFRSGELLARIRSALRKTTAIDLNPVIHLKNLEIDLANRMVKKNGEIIKLTVTEFSLIALFAKNAGKVLTHQFLLKTIWGPTFAGESQYLRVYVAQLRKKIEEDPNRPVFLITETGVGYRFIGKE